MTDWVGVLNNFVLQTFSGDLKTSTYPKEWDDLKMRISFGMGAPARVPWIAFIAPEMQVSKGFYPVYLYYKEFESLILAYGVSETEEYGDTWPIEVINSTQSISAYFDKKVPRYGDSFIFRAYKVKLENEKVYFFSDSSEHVSVTDLESDLATLLGYYKKVVSIPQTQVGTQPASGGTWGAGVFYMEKQLEDFIILNWNKTDLGKKYDLIIEEGELISQQYRTDIGPIDILARDKETGSHVVIELKKNQTSDDTIGQLARYMGWIGEAKKDQNVRGVIIAGSYDKKLDYALKVMKGVEVYLYEVDFKLKEFTN